MSIETMVPILAYHEQQRIANETINASTQIAQKTSDTSPFVDLLHIISTPEFWVVAFIAFIVYLLYKKNAENTNKKGQENRAN